MTPTAIATTTPPGAPPNLAPDAVFPLLVSVLIALVIFLCALILGRIARSASTRALQRTRADRSTVLLIGRIVFVAISVVGALTALGLLGVPWTTVVALTSVLGLAVSLAMQDVLKNFVAGIYLLVERPFRVGETVKIRDFVGIVESIDIRTTVLLAENGDRILVPNAILFAEIILNRNVAIIPAPADGDPAASDPSPI